MTSLDYQTTAFNLSYALKKLSDFADIIGNFPDIPESRKANLSALVTAARQRLERRCLKIAVVGEFNRGKSTFINAIIGKEILPADILPTTACINRIIHRLNPGCELIFTDGKTQAIALEKLADYVTKFSSRFSSKIKEAIIYYPLAFSQITNFAVEIIDTPGLNDDAQMTQITRSILPQCDLVLTMISAISPLSKNESNFLNSIVDKSGTSRVLCVVNFMDLLSSEAEGWRVLKSIKKRLQESLKTRAKEAAILASPKVWGISAAKALQGRQSQNMAVLAQSRLVNFEYDLRQIWQKESGLITLEVTVNQLRIVTREAIEQIDRRQEQLESTRLTSKKNAELIAAKISSWQSQKAELIATTNQIIASYQQQIINLESSWSDNFKQKASEVIAKYEQKIIAPETNWLNNLKKVAKSTVENREITTAKIAQFEELKLELARQIWQVLKETHQNLTESIQQELQVALNWSQHQLEELTESLREIGQEINTLIKESQINNLPLLNFSETKLEFKKIKELPDLNLPFPSTPQIFLLDSDNTNLGTNWSASIDETLKGKKIWRWEISPEIGAKVREIGRGIDAKVDTYQKPQEFQDKYQPYVMEVIENGVQLMSLEKTVGKFVTEAFNQLLASYSQVFSEVNLSIQTFQNSSSLVLDEREALAWNERQQLKNMGAEIEKIDRMAQEISLQLSQIGSA